MEAPPAVAAAIERARAAEFRISSEDCVGRLLAVLAAAVPEGGRVLEMGSGVGMGTAWIVTGLGERRDVEVVTVERDALLAEALRGWRWPAFVRLLHADALDALGRLGTFDLVFPDSHAGKYLGFDRTLAALRPGGLLLVDDMKPGPTAGAQEWSERAELRRTLFGHPELQAIDMDWCSGVILATRHRAGR
jgi:predicted O-methyltransferase YrrM